MAGDKTVDILKLIHRHVKAGESPGLRIVTVATTEPNPITFVFEGDDKAVAFSLFEVPVSLYPLRRGDRLIVYPITEALESQRWAALEKITTGTVIVGNVVGEHQVQVPDFDKILDSELLPALPEKLPYPDYYAAIVPTVFNGQLRYVVLRTFKYV